MYRSHDQTWFPQFSTKFRLSTGIYAKLVYLASIVFSLYIFGVVYYHQHVYAAFFATSAILQSNTVVFWHVYAPSNRGIEIAYEQLDQLLDGPLLKENRRGINTVLIHFCYSTPDRSHVAYDFLDEVKRRAAEKGSNDVTFFVNDNVESFSEADTLAQIYHFCLDDQHIDKWAVYLHNKGSSRDTEQNRILRRFATAYTWGEQSLGCWNVSHRHRLHFKGSEPSSFANAVSYKLTQELGDYCTTQLFVFPHQHPPGNFFWASCRHVRRLSPPLQSTAFQVSHFPVNNFSFPDNIEEWRTASNRYALEHWITRLPTSSVGASCVDWKRDALNEYTWAYRPPAISPYLCRYGIHSDWVTTAHRMPPNPFFIPQEAFSSSYVTAIDSFIYEQDSRLLRYFQTMVLPKLFEENGQSYRFKSGLVVEDGGGNPEIDKEMRQIIADFLDYQASLMTKR